MNFKNKTQLSTVSKKFYFIFLKGCSQPKAKWYVPSLADVDQFWNTSMLSSAMEVRVANLFALSRELHACEFISLGIESD